MSELDITHKRERLRQCMGLGEIEEALQILIGQIRGRRVAHSDLTRALQLSDELKQTILIAARVHNEPD